VIATLQSLLRRLTGPICRRSVVLLFVAGLWAAWEWLPPAPRMSWSLPADEADDFRISPDGTTIVTVAVRMERTHSMVANRGRCGPVRLWDTATGRQRANVLGSESLNVGVGFSPDNSWLWTTDDHHGIRVWDLVTGRAYPVARHPNGRDERAAFWLAAVSPDSRLIAAAFEGPKPVVHVWEATTGRTAVTLDGACHPLIFTPDSRELVAATVGTDARIWDVTSGRVRATLSGHMQCVGDIAVSPDGRLVASGLHRTSTPEPDRLAPTSVKLWDLPTAAALATIDVTDYPHNRWVLRFSPHGDLLVIDYTGASGLAWDVTTTPPTNRDDLLARTGYADGNRSVLQSTSLWFSPDGSWWLIQGWGKTTQTLLRATTGPPPPAPGLRPHSLAEAGRRIFAPDGRTDASIDSYSRPTYTNDLNGLIDRLLRRPAPNSKTQHPVSLVTADTRRTLVTFPALGEECQLVGYGPGGQTFWTADLVRPPTWGAEGTWVFRGWDVPSGWPPAWPLGVTLGGLVLIAVDWRRGRRRIPNRMQSA
jgi:WD40 repeat protein